MDLKAVIFNVDNVLYDARFQKDAARINALRAMVEAGLPIDVETGFRVLNEVVKEYGSDYQMHFDEMLKRLGLKWNPRVIAAGVVAYRETSRAYLTPYPDTVPTIVKLRDMSLKIGVISSGNPVKQWQKLINLGVQHLCHIVIMSGEHGKNRVDVELFNLLLNQVGLKPEECMFVGGDFNDIAVANQLGILTVRVRRGGASHEEAPEGLAKPKHELKSLKELLSLVEELKAEST
jgi:putative hydrolase of the HAD superfamily